MAQIYAAINVFLITVLSNARTRLIPFRPQPCPLRPRHPADVHRRAIISINSFFFFSADINFLFLAAQIRHQQDRLHLYALGLPLSVCLDS